MFDQEKFQKSNSFWNSPEGKKIMILGGILVVVILAYFGTSMLRSNKENKNGKKQSAKQDSSLPKTLEGVQKKWTAMLKNKKPYEPVRAEMMEITSDLSTMNQNQLVFMAVKNDPPDVKQLKSGTSSAKGKVIKYSGTVTSIIKKPIHLRNQKVYEIWIKSKKADLYYRIHALSRPPSHLKENESRVEGEAVYLNTLKETPPGKEENGETVPVVGLLSIKVRGAPDQLPEPEEENGDQTQNEDNGSTPDMEQVGSVLPSSLPPAGDYTEKDQVTTRWGMLLRNVDKIKPLQAGSPVYNRMVNELQKVPPERLSSWVQKDLKPNLLRNGSSYFRGKVVPFKGVFMTGKQLPIDGRPRGGEGMWSLWIRDFENKVTYVVHTFERPPKGIKKMSHVKGKGVYLQTPGYELKNPPKKGKEGRLSPAVFLMGHSIQPNPAAAPKEAESNPWVEYILGGLAALFLGVFFLVVYLSSRKDAESQTSYRSKLREGRDGRKLSREEKAEDADDRDSDSEETEKSEKQEEKEEEEETFSEETESEDREGDSDDDGENSSDASPER